MVKNNFKSAVHTVNILVCDNRKSVTSTGSALCAVTLWIMEEYIDFLVPTISKMAIIMR